MNRKKTGLLALAMITAISMAGCGSSDKSAYITGITATDYVDLADYSAIPVEAAAPSVSDSYVEMYINYTLSGDASYEEVKDRDTVQSGDTVNIDYTGKIDGETFDGGSAEGYNLQIGSGSFISGFEDGLIGKKAGSTVTLHLKFPDDYTNTDVAGKDVDFDVTINRIETLVTPELTDDWVAGQNISGVSTVEQYRDYVKEQLLAQEQQSYDADVENQIITYLEDNSSFRQDPPAAMVDRFYTQVEEYYTRYAAQYGMDLATFMQYVSPSEDDSSETSDETSASGETSDSDSDEAADAKDVADAVTADAAEDSAEAAAETENSSQDASADAAAETPAYEATLREQATRMAKQYILLKAVAEKEEITIGKREYNSALDSEAASAGYSSVSEYKKNEDANAFYESLLTEKVMKFLVEKAVITEPAASETEDAADGTADSTGSASGSAQSDADVAGGAENADGAESDTAAQSPSVGRGADAGSEEGTSDSAASSSSSGSTGEALGREETEAAAQMGY